MTKHHPRKLVIFFVHYNSTEELEFPKIVQDHMNSGCTVAMVTFGWDEFFISESFASKDLNGRPLAFNIETKNFDQFASCHLKVGIMFFCTKNRKFRAKSLFFFLLYPK